jgi:hypothetical protein
VGSDAGKLQWPLVIGPSKSPVFPILDAAELAVNGWQTLFSKLSNVEFSGKL